MQDELRSVRSQLDELLNLGQDLVSKSEKYSKLVAPDIENITRKFEELQRRIHLIQVRMTHFSILRFHSLEPVGFIVVFYLSF